ncbi:intraflagellar transport protein 43 homolog [Centruroides vittatus]|uniref:intraflagellar transport protein 43 homolog n=1 Tax=Centruroides vittatus TaxID=120091 RepID=UPI00351044F9
MEDDDLGLDFDLDSPPKKAPPRLGRRSENTNNQSPLRASSFDLESPPSGKLSPNKSGPPKVPPRSRKTGGWAEDPPSSAMRWLRRSARPNTNANNTKQETKTEIDDSDSEIPVIPDLDEVKDEDFVSQIAQAPSVAVNRVATYQELDNDLLKHAAFNTLDGIDLRLLTKCLAPENDIKEEVVACTWDIIFADISSELTVDSEEKTEKDDLVIA